MVDRRGSSLITFISAGHGVWRPTRPTTALAAWICAIAEPVGDIEDLLDDSPPPELILRDQLEESPWPWDIDSMLVALFIVRTAYLAGEENLAELLTG